MSDAKVWIASTLHRDGELLSINSDAPDAGFPVVLAAAYNAVEADRDRLAAELDALKAERASFGREVEQTAQRVIDELQAELSAARADAERYRWLRSRMFSRAVPYAVGTALDQEIDAARAAPSAGSAPLDNIAYTAKMEGKS